MFQAFFNANKKYKLGFAKFASVYVIVAALAAIANILMVRATGEITQAAESGADIFAFLTVLLAAGGINAVLTSIAAWISKRYNGHAIYRVRKNFAERLLRMPYKDFEKKQSGEGASLFTNDVPQTAQFVSVQVFSQISQIATLVASIVFMLLINWWLTLGFFALFPILATLQTKLSAPMSVMEIEASKRTAEFNNVVADALQNPLTLKAYGLEAATERRFDEVFQKYYRAKYRAAKIVAGLSVVGVFATLTPLVVLYVVAGALVINGSMDLAQFISLVIIAAPASEWLAMFGQELTRLRTASASAVRVMEFEPATEGESLFEINIVKSASVISFENVNFSYVEGTNVLDRVSFNVEPGKITALAGPSGTGKSTILKLLLGLYKPTSGTVSLASGNIAYVPQDCALLPMSIRENILCGSPLNEESLRSACENAGILKFIDGLPNGFDTVLTESAANISGGQKQRLAMARAFYRDADVLLLDEATASLDPETETAVLTAFRAYIKQTGKTALVVAHRQAALDMADNTITLTKTSEGGGANESQQA